MNVGLFPIELHESISVEGEQQYIIDSVYSELYDNISALFTSNEFISLFQTEFTSSSIVSYYSEGKSFDNSTIFTLENDITASYYLNKDNLDTMVYGRFNHIEDLLIFELIKVDRDLTRNTLYSNIITKNHLFDELSKMFKAVVEDLTDIETGILHIDYDHKHQITLKLNNTVITTPSHEIFNVLPKGVYAVSIYLEDVLLEKRNIAVLDYYQEIEIEQDGLNGEQHYISSMPLGATLSINAQNVGETPFILSNQYDRQYSDIIEMDLDGFELFRKSLSESSLQEVIYLRPYWLDFKEQIAIGKRSFYDSLGTVILTLPISIFSKFMYDTTNQGYWKTLQLAGNTTTVYLGIRSIIDLLDYYHRIY